VRVDYVIKSIWPNTQPFFTTEITKIHKQKIFSIFSKLVIKLLIQMRKFETIRIFFKSKI